EGAIGGFGAHVLQYLATTGLLDRGLKLRPMVLPDRFIDHDKPHSQYDQAGLNAKHIVATALAALGQAAEGPAASRAWRVGCGRPTPATRSRQRMSQHAAIDTSQLTAAHDVVEDVVVKARTSFYWAMRLLPAEKRQAMFAVYAFCRVVDDIADG